MKLRYLAACLLIFCSASLFGQRVKISGVVSDPTGLPIELVTVQEQGTANGTFSDAKGKYALSISQKDSAVLVFSCLGYNTTKIKLPAPTEDLVMNVRMRNEDYALEGVTITANQINTNTMEQIKTDQVRLAADATGGSIESVVIMTATGVSMNNELSSQYSVRGGNYNENIVYVNGIEVYRPLLIRNAQQEGLSFINPDLTDRVQFSSGGFDARYGDKMSSVLDVTYKKPERLFEGGVTGSLLGGSAYVGSASGKFSQISGIRYKRGTTLLQTLDTKGDYNPSVVDFQTFMTYDFTSKLSLNFMGNYADNAYDFNPSTRETSYGTMNDPKKFKVFYDGKERDRFRTLFGAASLNYAHSDNAGAALQISGFQSREEETYDITGEYWISNVMEGESDAIGTGMFHQHARDYLISQVFNVAITGYLGINQHSLRGSLGIQQEHIRDRINEWELRDSSGYSLPYQEEALRVYSSLFSRNEISSVRVFGYLQDTYKFRIREGLLALTAGVRANYWNYNKELIISPRISVGFVPSGHQNITLRLATGLYYQPPFYKEFRIVDTDADGNSYIYLNKSIQSQRSIHFVAGGDYGFKFDGRPFRFTAEMYYKKLDHIVPYTLDNVKVWYSGFNNAKGHVVGIDTKLFGQFVPGTDSWLGFSLMQARQNIDSIHAPMPTDQLYNITLFYTDYLPGYKKLQGNLKLIFSQGLPFSVPGSYDMRFRAPKYLRADFGMTYKLLDEEDLKYRSHSIWRYIRNAWIGFDIFNIFDVKNVGSYSWFTDADGHQNAVPDRLTGRQINLKLVMEF